MVIHSERAAHRLLIHPHEAAQSRRSGIVTSLSPRDAGWEFLGFEVRCLAPDQTWPSETGDCELGLVVLGGTCTVRSDRGEWRAIGERSGVFAGLPFALYLPRHTAFEVLAVAGPCDVALGRAPADEDHPPRLVTPADVRIEIRGGNNATRQIHAIYPPGFDCQRLVAVEVYTPGGNWSSYPPHKHDVHRVDSAGRLLEADLEEIYFYRFSRPGGFAVQRI